MHKNIVEHFGEHLTIDGYGGDMELLNSKDMVLEVLGELPSVLDINILMPPQVVFAPDSGQKDPGGWSVL